MPDASRENRAKSTWRNNGGRIPWPKCCARVRDVLADIHALEEELLAFERKYGIRSETLYAAYVSGEEPEKEVIVAKSPQK